MFKLILCLALLQTAAFAQSLRPGVYKGTKSDVRMFLQAMPGRDGSFLGLIVKNGDNAVPYLVDEFATARYGFIPLYNQKNLIGASNYTPSLTASLVSSRKGLQINVAPNPGNNIGFSEAMSFKSTSESSPWLSSRPGVYSYSESRKKYSATLSPQDGNRESQLTINGGSMAGSYVLREVRPGMHLAFKSTLSTTGVEVVEESRWVVVFLKGCFGWSNNMVFIDTNNRWTMKEFKLK